MGSTEPLFEEDRISIYVDDDVPCLVNVWNGFVPGEKFRQYIRTLLEVYKEVYQKYDHLPLLADTRNLQAISPKDIDWVAKEMNHRYVELGCHYEAFIVPQDVFGQAAVRRYTKQSTSAGTFITNIFSNSTDAKNWLREVQSVVPK